MRALITFLWSLVLMMSCAARESGTDDKKQTRKRTICLQGGYIQLLDSDSWRSELEWRKLFESLIQLNIKYVVVQWSALDHRPYYRAVPVAAAPDMPLESIMRLASASGMRVLVGLSHDPAYWTRVGRPDRRAYLVERLRINQRRANELREIVIHYPSFSGWYISEEIDDINWNSQLDKVAISNYLGELSNHLRKLTPKNEIGVSGFVNRHTEPNTLRDFWIDLLASAPAIDHVYFQDGIGVNKLTIAELPRYYAAMLEATTAAGRELVPVVEAFRQTAGPPVSPGEFRAGPTTLERLSEQIGIANRYAVRHVLFGVPEYLTPAGGVEAAMLYRNYNKVLSAAGCPAIHQQEVLIR